MSQFAPALKRKAAGNTSALLRGTCILHMPACKARPMPANWSSDKGVVALAIDPWACGPKSLTCLV